MTYEVARLSLKRQNKGNKRFSGSKNLKSCFKNGCSRRWKYSNLLLFRIYKRRQDGKSSFQAKSCGARPSRLR